ncbi:MAG: S46 family peptidase [Saprospiraceae bacterium]|nr:S46 family peptidase [Saprospiraceae bacterium]
MKKLLFLLFFIPALLRSQGGMWVPLLLEKQNEKEMKSLGLKLDADDIYAISQPSLKDAICQFDGGCTGEMISPEGLLLTNHHCGFDAIQQLSTLENNYIENGYWAKNRTEELRAEGVTAVFISRMEDVTALAMQGVTESMAERDRQALIDKNLAQIRVNTKKDKWEDIITRPFYNGNQYYLFVTQTFKDVRFVGAPPSSIGKFGADTDNWVWPRHTGDFSMFRVYAGKDNQPAEYSKDNVPYHPKKFLSISLDGAEEDEFTMVYGFPGRTDEYLSEAGVRQVGEVLDPARVSVRDRALKILDGFMRKDPAVKIAYIAKYASISNAWKKWLGEMQGLKSYKALDKKRAYEAEFTSRVDKNADFKYRYANLLPRLRQLYQDIEPYALTRDYYLEACVRNNEILGLAASLNSWIETYDKNGEAFFAGKQKEATSGLESFYKDYRPEVDEAVFAGLMEIYAQNVRDEWGAGFVKTAAGKNGGYAGLASAIFKNSALAGREKMNALLAEKPAAIAEALKNDPAYTLWKALNDAYQANVQPKLQELQPQINMLQRQYMAAQMQVFKEKRFFPDANSTLRLTYGKVDDYSPRDAVEYEDHTYLEGVMEKYVPGDYEFDVPKKLIELWKSKDYGQYADAEGRMPVAFIATNHTTGGNSGSPALDANGNLVGLNFDRVWEGTMSDLNYDPAICRNIMVDLRYVLFIVDKYGGAGYLTNEMKLVKGVKKRKKK